MLSAQTYEVEGSCAALTDRHGRRSLDVQEVPRVPPGTWPAEAVRDQPPGLVRATEVGRDDARDARSSHALGEVACLDRELETLDRPFPIGGVVRRSGHLGGEVRGIPVQGLTIAGPIESQLTDPKAFGRVKSRYSASVLFWISSPVTPRPTPAAGMGERLGAPSSASVRIRLG
jgi:hypothetical protein